MAQRHEPQCRTEHTKQHARARAGAAQVLPAACEHRSSSCAVGLLARARERGGRALARASRLQRGAHLWLTCFCVSCGVKRPDSSSYRDDFTLSPS